MSDDENKTEQQQQLLGQDNAVANGDAHTDMDSSSDDSDNESDYEPLFPNKKQALAAEEEKKSDSQRAQPRARPVELRPDQLILKGGRRPSDDDDQSGDNQRIIKKRRSRTLAQISHPAEVIEVRQLVLTDVQMEHYDTIITCLRDVFPLYYDFSDMGSGKTPVAVAVSLEFDLPIFCIAPVTTGPNWHIECSKYGAKVETITGCEALRGVKHKPVKHGLLTRTEPPSRDVQEARTKNNQPRIADDESAKVTYHVTDKLRQLVQRGILLIVDECQSIKNDSDQNRAVGAIARHIVEMGIAGSRSRVMMLSGSAFNKEEHCTNVARCSGLVDEKPYSYDRVSRTFVIDGADQMLTLCETLDPMLYDRLRSRNNIFYSKVEVEHHIFVLFDRIIRAHLSNAMPAVILPVKLDCSTGYYRQSAENAEALRLAIRGLRVIVNHKIGERIELGALNAALQEIELHKIDIVVRLVRHELLQRPSAKIIVMVWFHQSIGMLTTAFDDLQPLVLTGQVKKMQDRQRIVNEFNREDMDSPQVLLATCQVASTGLNLQDMSVGGQRPRFQLVLPSYHFIPLHQSIKRTYRHGATSDVKVRFIFGETQEETALLQSLSRSSSVLRQISSRRDNKEPVRTLTDYPAVTETVEEYEASQHASIADAVAHGIAQPPEGANDEERDAALVPDDIPMPALERVMT